MQCEKEMRAAGQAERANVQPDELKFTTNEEQAVTGAEVMRIAAAKLDKDGKDLGSKNGLPLEFHVFMKTLEKLSEIADEAHRLTREEVAEEARRCIIAMKFAMLIGSVTGRENANAAVDRIFEIDETRHDRG